MFARPPKHLLGDPVQGPYLVKQQNTLSSVVLFDPATNSLVDHGANIPLDQILAGPKRAKLSFPDDSDVRSYGQMLRREGARHLVEMEQEALGEEKAGAS